MFVEIVAKDNIHPDIWHNDKIGQTFEVVEVKNDAIPPRYIVKYNHPSGRADTAAVVFSCAKEIKEIMNEQTLTPTMKMRLVEIENNTDIPCAITREYGTSYFKFQQYWAKKDGTGEWRDVPIEYNPQE
jgi:hypothetical protein